MLRFIACLTGVLFASAAVAQAVKAPPKDLKVPPRTTLESLQAAYDGESNAHARYQEFAKKADTEGYAGVASLFRAAAHAEKIHADNHAAVIKKLGATPLADVKKPDVKTTKENLQTAINGEIYERDTMYPDFLRIARFDKNMSAVETFNYAMATEAEHAKLYQEALKNLEAWKGGPREFFVCSVCGNTLPKIDFKKCPVCMSPKDKYEKIS